MNSRQGARYIKRRMGNEMKNKILFQNGIITENESRSTPSVRNCPKCEFVNAYHHMYCEKCAYPLTSEAYDRIKEDEDKKLKQEFQLQLDELKRENVSKIDELKEFFTDKLNLFLQYFDTTDIQRIQKLSPQGGSFTVISGTRDKPDNKNSGSFVGKNGKVQVDENPLKPDDFDLTSVQAHMTTVERRWQKLG